LVLDDAIKRYSADTTNRATFAVHDMTVNPVPGRFDAIFSLDVIEHIPETTEKMFLDNICASLSPQAVCILGTPNITANEYASPASKAGHINLKSAETLHTLLSSRFHNVFNFSMNDEVIHTGYSPMAHYLFAVGAGLKD